MVLMKAGGPKKKKESLGMRILRTLRTRILNWEYPPNKPLLEEALCREFGVSRSPVREALRMLAAEGFALRLPNRTFVVKQIHPDEVKEIYELRLALELYIVERLCEIADINVRLAPLRKTWQELSNSRQQCNSAEAARHDQEFHEGLSAILGNRAISDVLRSFSEKLHIFRILDFEHPGRFADTCHQHITILDAMEAGNAGMARQCLLQNISQGQSNASAGVQKALWRSYF